MSSKELIEILAIFIVLSLASVGMITTMLVIGDGVCLCTQ